jgi:hypothetical protein
MTFYNSEDPDHRQRLMATYQTERQDDQSAIQAAFAIIATALTYVLVVAAYLLDHCGENGKCDAGAPAPLRYLSPVVPVAFAGFLVLNVSATRMRSVAIQRLEEVLALTLPVRTGGKAPHLHTDSGLVYRPDHRTRSQKGGWIKYIYSFITAASYLAIYSLLLSFTWLALYWGPWDWPKLTVMAVYVITELILVAGLIASLFSRPFKKP